jgi:hypothetical protein
VQNTELPNNFYLNTMLKTQTKHTYMTEASSATKEHTILPVAKISAVVFGSLILITTAAKR